MQKAFNSALGLAYNAAYGDDSISPYAILDENLDALTDLLGNVIEDEY